jgi:uncharacterized membrane protein YkvA (DUF1232 family)
MSKSRLPTPSPGEQAPLQPENKDSVSWLRDLIRQARLAWRLFLDPRVPWALKLIPPTAFLYLLSPIDILPDFSPGLGQLDDIAVILLGIKLFIELAPADIVREHLRALGAKISEWGKEQDLPAIEGEFTVEGEEE